MRTLCWAVALNLSLLFVQGGEARADFLTPQVSTAFTLNEFASGLGALTDFRFLPDGRMVSIERNGTVRLRRSNGSVVTVGQFAVSQTVPSQGLLGLEVHPSFLVNGKLYFFLSVPGSAEDARHRVVSAVLSEETLDTAGAQTVVDAIAGPGDHNGGSMAFGRDGLLYIAVGDGGCECACSPGGEPVLGMGFNYRPTCLTAPNGKILRVDAAGAIPSSNPLTSMTSVVSCSADCRSPVSQSQQAPPRQDIFAWGFHNPSGLWVDPITGSLWATDTGNLTLEEINLVRRSEHYGAPFREGAQGLDAGVCGQTTPQSGDCVDPLYACRHSGAVSSEDSGCDSLLGGFIVPSCTYPSPLKDLYLFADSVSGTLFGLRPNFTRSGFVLSEPRLEIGTVQLGKLMALRQGPEGYLYAGMDSGRVAVLVPLIPPECSKQTPDGGSTLDGGAPKPGTGSAPNPSRPSGQVTDGSFNSCGCVAGSRDFQLLGAWPLLALLLWTYRRRVGGSKGKGL